MEFYAKSKEYEFSADKLRAVKKAFETLLDKIYVGLTKKEMEILNSAHDSLGKKVVKPQKTLKEHLDETKAVAEDFFDNEKGYGIYFTEIQKELAVLACELHDIGKSNLLFQYKIGNKLINPTEKDKEIPHGFLSALSIGKEYFQSVIKSISDEKELKDAYLIWLNAVFHHHTRDTSDLDKKYLSYYSEKYYDQYLKMYLEDEAMRLNASLLNKISYLHNNNLSFDESFWLKFILIKGMLNKFDYISSSGFDRAEIYVDMKSKLLYNSIIEKLPSLREAQVFMKDNSDNNVILIAGTGSGKTEAALLWLNGEKAFYTLPLKVSSTAIYDRIRETYAYDYVTLIHSDSFQKLLSEEHEHQALDRYEQSRLLSYPLSVCTVDQIFKFVYKALGTEIFAATLKYSKVIVDEIQAYSPRLVATLIYGLVIVKKLGGKFAIITATFPPIIKDFMERYGLLDGDKAAVYKDYASNSELKRHFIQIIREEMDFDAILKAAKTKKVLVICNTVAESQRIYSELTDRNKDEIYVKLLHSKFIRKHRGMLETEIMRFSDASSENGIWVSTQIVEASLDIDFDELHTQMSTADSLLQRLGRCNRKGRYIPDSTNVYVYVKEKGFSIYDKDILKRSIRFLGNYTGKIFTEKMKISYINEVYNTDEIEDTEYYREIEAWIKHFKLLKPEDYTKSEVDKKFRDINSISIIPDNIYNENIDLIDASMEFLNTSHIGYAARSVIRAKLDDLSLSINVYNGRKMEGVSRESIKITDANNSTKIYDSKIHRCQMKYDFDEENLYGKGMSVGQLEEGNQFL